MPVYNVDSKDEFDKIVSESEIPVFVKFFASWCGPCQLATPVVRELSTKYNDKLKFIQIDVDSNSCRDIVYNYSVSSIPTFVILKNGEEFNRLNGFVDKERLEDFIKDCTLV